ncbi:DUF2852 domain-containing protein [Sulfitobacter sp.]|jgi:uncharacterized protein DUF2852|uniref:DUF2852 domain-containing protein n=1 Tax=Sulfitobacter sp. TaxID=1903071 RepID=UPI000C100C37|nr:hypothetical protein [Roseobacter sp.]MBV47139.1 hypothetical protein [Roseobacter sp.]PHR09740.1 MAG: hypothetical protein COB29_02820 [Sulfitobacter sp.]|tara:strand:+ start:1672 stop:2079 length:408 start_codon:yes stop_codon:yes gene_type:complete
MSQTYAPAFATGRNWLGRAEDFLDARGKAAWIAAMVVGFIAFWPVGLALLAYMIWSKRMFKSSSCAKRSTVRNFGSRSTGNAAFDAYKADTLARLEEEQSNFEAFLARLREAKDKAEFDQFMAERAPKDQDAQTS